MKKKAQELKKNRKKSGSFLTRMIEKKQYFEFFTILLTIPFLITVLLLNLNSLKNLNSPKEETKANPYEASFFTKPTSDEPQSAIADSNTTTVPCNKAIGPIEISSPKENETVTDNPVFVEVAYDDPDYCPVVWSYRVNGKSWSAYGDSSIALYNMNQGNIKVELKIKSSFGTQEKTVTRNFLYKGTTVISPPGDTPSGSSSAQ